MHRRLGDHARFAGRAPEQREPRMSSLRSQCHACAIGIVSAAFAVLTGCALIAPPAPTTPMTPPAAPDDAGNGVSLLMAREFAPLPQRLHNVGERLIELPRLLAQVREVLDPARVPRIHAETAVKQHTGVLTLIDQLVVPQLGVLPEDERGRLKSAIGRARTAVTQHQLWLEKRLLPDAKGDFRLGAELYDVKLRFALDSPLSREQIRARAQSELTRTRADMYAIARAILPDRPNPA